MEQDTLLALAVTPIFLLLAWGLWTPKRPTAVLGLVAFAGYAVIFKVTDFETADPRLVMTVLMIIAGAIAFASFVVVLYALRRLGLLQQPPVR